MQKKNKNKKTPHLFIGGFLRTINTKKGGGDIETERDINRQWLIFFYLWLVCSNFHYSQDWMVQVKPGTRSSIFISHLRDRLRFWVFTWCVQVRWAGVWIRRIARTHDVCHWHKWSLNPLCSYSQLEIQIAELNYRIRK